jgi:hypothetical protein
MKPPPTLHAAAACAAVLLMLAAPAWSQQAPDAEAEFWRSADRIHTVDAYRAYLKAFPEGLHAELARAAISSLGEAGAGSAAAGTGVPVPAAPRAPAAAPAAPTSTGLAGDPAKLLAGGGTSGSVTMMPGETYLGTGPMTVGYLGAKKQLVVPPGAWLLLSEADHKSSHAAPVSLTTMVFGQFRGGQLQSLLLYLFNGRPGPISTRWPDLDHCLAQEGPRGSLKVMQSHDVVRACGWVVRQNTLPAFNNPAWDQAMAALVRLGGAVPQGSMLFSRLWLGDNTADHLNIRRIDFDNRAWSLEQRGAWLQAYVHLAIDGFHRRVRADELEPGQPPTGARLSLVD